MNRVLSILIGLAVALWLLSYTVFIVDQRKYAIVTSLGEMRQIIEEPGLHFKFPPFQSVVFIEKRTMLLETPESDRFSATEKDGQKTDLLVNAMVKWQIADPKLNYVSMGPDEARTRERLAQAIKAALSEEVAKHSAHDLVSTERGSVADAVRLRVAADVKQIGVDIVDLHIKRVDYTDQANTAVLERMKAERLRIAAELRAQGNAELERIRSDADRQSNIAVSEAKRDAEIARGEGDAKASQIYAQAFGQNPEFYKFYRSLEAYRASFKSRSDVMVVDPNSEFFKYMKNPDALGAKK
jgi:membrane protease subunit HflC